VPAGTSASVVISTAGTPPLGRKSQRLAQNVVLHVLDALHLFERRIFQVDAGKEGLGDRDVDVFVDRDRDQVAAEAPVV